MTTFAEGRERNLALGIYGAASGSGAAAGVLLGGVLTSYLSWSWIFFVNVPVGIAAALLALVLLGESRSELGHRHLDARGAVTATAGLMLLVYALSRATTDGWASAAALLPLVGSVALLSAFVALEARSPWPLLPLRLFRGPSLAAANVAMAIIGAVAFSEFFVLSLYLQDILGYSAMQGGVAFVAFAGTVVVVSNLAQVIVARIGARATLTAGLLTVGALGRAPDPPAGGRPLLLGSLPGIRPRRRRYGALLRPGDDPRPRRRQPGRRRRCIRADQHEPSDRRRDRYRRVERDRGSRDRSLQRSPRDEPGRARPRLPDRARRSGRAAASRRSGRRRLHPPCDRRGRADGPPCPSRRCSTRPP